MIDKKVATDDWKKSAIAVPQGRGMVCLGIVPSAGKAPWRVWITVFSNHIEVLSAWRTRAQAEAALSRYAGNLDKGHLRFIEEVERSRIIDGYETSKDLTLNEINELMLIANKAMGIT